MSGFEVEGKKKKILEAKRRLEAAAAGDGHGVGR